MAQNADAAAGGQETEEQRYRQMFKYYINQILDRSFPVPPVDHNGNALPDYYRMVQMRPQYTLLEIVQILEQLQSQQQKQLMKIQSTEKSRKGMKPAEVQQM